MNSIVAQNDEQVPQSKSSGGQNKKTNKICTTAWITYSMPGTSSQREYLISLVAEAGYKDAEAAHALHFIVHLYASCVKAPKGKYSNNYIPVSREFIDKYLQKLELSALMTFGIINRTRYYSEEQGISYEYAIHSDIYERFNSLAINDVMASKGGNLEVINLIDGKPYKTPKHELYDAERNSIPALQAKAFKAHRFLYLDMVSGWNYVQAKRDEVEAIKEKHGYQSSEAVHAQHQLNNIVSCYLMVHYYRPVYVDNGLAVVIPAYKSQESGRMSAQLGLIQNMPREMQAAFLAGVPNVHNYDLVASQANMLRQELTKAGISSEWLNSYIENPKSKYQYATQVFQSADHKAVSAWKTILCAILMGSKFPSEMTDEKVKAKLLYLEKNSNNDGAAMVELFNYYFGQANWLDKAVAAYKRLVTAIKPLIKAMKLWHTYLFTTWKAANLKTSKAGQYVTNAYGMKMYLKLNPGAKAPNGCKLKPNGKGYRKDKEQSKLAAFILQGQEAYFIAVLTTLGEKYGFQPMCNMHDGLVTQNEIPEEAVAEAALITNTENAKLEEKPFAVEKLDTTPATVIDNTKVDAHSSYSSFEVVDTNLLATAIKQMINESERPTTWSLNLNKIGVADQKEKVLQAA